MTTANPATREALSQPWLLAVDPAAQVCPFRAAAALHDGPDIIFVPGEEHVRSAGLGGNWVVTRHALQEEILLDPVRFSSHLSIGFSRLIGENWPLVLSSVKANRSVFACSIQRTPSRQVGGRHCVPSANAACISIRV